MPFTRSRSLRVPTKAWQEVSCLHQQSEPAYFISQSPLYSRGKRSALATSNLNHLVLRLEALDICCVGPCGRTSLYGYLAHKKQTPLEPYSRTKPRALRVPRWGGALSYERGTPLQHRRRMPGVWRQKRSLWRASSRTRSRESGVQKRCVYAAKLIPRLDNSADRNLMPF